MVKTTDEKLTSAVEKLKKAEGSAEGDITPEKRADIRKSKKKVKRLQRRLSKEKAVAAKRDAVEANRLKNIEKAKEKEAKKKAAEEGALAAAAEKQAEEEKPAEEETAAEEEKPAE